jgi:hypothetical protein
MTEPQTLNLDELIDKLSEFRDRLGTGHHPTNAVEVSHRNDPEAQRVKVLTNNPGGFQYHRGKRDGHAEGVLSGKSECASALIELRELKDAHGWRSIKDNPPTEHDADDQGSIELWSEKVRVCVDYWDVFKDDPDYTHWRPITPPKVATLEDGKGMQREASA